MTLKPIIPIGLFAVYALIKLGGYLTGNNDYDILIVSGVLWSAIISSIVVFVDYCNKWRKRTKIK